MKLKVLSITGNELGNIELPVQFFEPVRDDLIKKAVLAIQNNKRQAYGAFEKAGMRHSADLSKRRRKYRGSYGHGISRVPRKILSRRGTQMHWVGAIVPGTVGGRKGHPPKAVKNWTWKINISEKRKAIRSAMHASMDAVLVAKRGHLVPNNYPFVIEEKLEGVNSTRDLKQVLYKLGFKDDLARADKIKIRAGKGKIRGRRKLTKKSVLLVVSEADSLRRAASNILGVEVINVKRLNAEALAPGAMPGRPALFTTKAIEVLKTGLFMKNYKGDSTKKVKEKKTKPKKEKKVKKKAVKEKKKTDVKEEKSKEAKK